MNTRNKNNIFMSLALVALAACSGVVSPTEDADVQQMPDHVMTVEDSAAEAQVDAAVPEDVQDSGADTGIVEDTGTAPDASNEASVEASVEAGSDGEAGADVAEAGTDAGVTDSSDAAIGRYSFRSNDPSGVIFVADNLDSDAGVDERLTPANFTVSMFVDVGSLIDSTGQTLFVRKTAFLTGSDLTKDSIRISVTESNIQFHIGITVASNMNTIDIPRSECGAVRGTWCNIRLSYDSFPGTSADNFVATVNGFSRSVTLRSSVSFYGRLNDRSGIGIGGTFENSVARSNAGGVIISEVVFLDRVATGADIADLQSHREPTNTLIAWRLNRSTVSTGRVIRTGVMMASTGANWPDGHP